MPYRSTALITLSRRFSVSSSAAYGARQVRQDLATGGRDVRLHHRRASRPSSDVQASHAAPSRRSASGFIDRQHHAELREKSGEHSPSRRYLQPVSGVLAVAAAGVLCAFCCVVDTLSEQCLRRKPRANPLVAAVFRTKWLLRERRSATCPRRRRPGQVRHRQGGLQITAVLRAAVMITAAAESGADRTLWCRGGSCPQTGQCV